MNSPQPILRAGEAVASRLRIIKRLAQQAREREDTITLQPNELWEPADDEALANWETEMAKAMGQEPLFKEV